MNRPTGIIRTLPSLAYGAGSGGVGRRKLDRSIAQLEAGHDISIHIALAQKPNVEVLHLYLLIEGEVRLRLNIAGYTAGHTAKCWDGAYRSPKYWAICSGPVSKPPSPIKMRGFQGFRYTEDLW